MDRNLEYLFGGIALETDFRFDRLDRPADRGPRHRLHITCGNGPPPLDTIVHRGNGRYRLTTGRVGGTAGDDWVFRSCFPDVFVFSPAHDRVACHLASDDDRAWQDVLFRRVLPRVAVRYGATALHAAAIALDDRCLLLLGRSGAGKSTLTAFCAKVGWEVLSDDLSVAWADDRIVVEPVQHGVGVWDATRDALALPAADCVAMPGYDGRKWCFRPATGARARPLSAVVAIERSAGVDAPCPTPLTREETLQALVRQDVPFLPEASPSAATAAAFGRVAAIARRVPGLRLTYPDGYAALPAVESLLRRLPVG